MAKFIGEGLVVKEDPRWTDLGLKGSVVDCYDNDFYGGNSDEYFIRSGYNKIGFFSRDCIIILTTTKLGKILYEQVEI